METLRDDSKRQQNLAALRIQLATRSHQAWRVARSRFRLRWNQVYDETRGTHFFVDRVTGEQRWERPRLAGIPVPIPDMPSRLAEDMGQDEAAGIIVGMFRASRAHRTVALLARAVFKVVRDPATNQKYYFNTKTGLSSWKRPKLLGPERKRVKALRTRRTGRKLSQRSTSRMRSMRSTVRASTAPRPKSSKVRMGRRAQDLDADQAATKLQAWARWVRSRSVVVQACLQVYQKVYDSSADAYFYFNTRLETSSWRKPTALGSHDVDVVGTDRPNSGRVRTGRKAADLSPAAAAATIVSALRMHHARQTILKTAAATWESVWSEEHGDYFFYNSQTGASVWEQPILLTLAGQRGLVRDPASHGQATSGSGMRAQGARLRTARRAENLSEVQAAIILQAFARAVLSRGAFRTRAAEVYEKCTDTEYMAPYYFNRSTFESSWEKPQVFRRWDLPLCSESDSLSLQMRTSGRVFPRLGRRAKDLSTERAARKIQSMVRMRQGWLAAVRQARTCLEKVWSDEYGAYYYHNKATDEAFWAKPALLGGHEIAPTPRSHASAVAAGAEPASGPLPGSAVRLTPRGTNLILGPPGPPPRQELGGVRRAFELGEDEAAVIVQRWTRGALARKRTRHLIRHSFERVWDESYQAHYFFNKLTGESAWDTPALIVRLFGSSATLLDTPRNKAVSVRLGVRPRHKPPRTGRRAHDLSEAAACLKLQSAMRMFAARRLALALLHARVRKVWHAEHGAYFYYDTLRHAATWFKPAILRHADMRESSMQALIAEVRRLQPQFALASDADTAAASCPAEGLPAISELSSQAASRITTARSSIEPVQSAPSSAPPTWRPDWDRLLAHPSGRVLPANAVELPPHRVKELHLRQLRVFSLKHAPQLADQLEALWSSQGVHIWSHLEGQFPGQLGAFQATATQQVEHAASKLAEAVATSLEGKQQGGLAGDSSGMVSAARKAAAERGAGPRHSVSFAALASSVRRVQPKVLGDPVKRFQHREEEVRATTPLDHLFPSGMGIAPIQEEDGDDDTSDGVSTQVSSRVSLADEAQQGAYSERKAESIDAARAFFASLSSRSTRGRGKGRSIGAAAEEVVPMHRASEASTPRPGKEEATAMAQGSNLAASAVVPRNVAFASTVGHVEVAAPVPQPLPAQGSVSGPEAGPATSGAGIPVAREPGMPHGPSGRAVSDDMSSVLTRGSVHSFKSLDLASKLLSYDEAVQRWSRKFSQEEGRFYYLDSTTGESSWERPGDLLEYELPLSPKTQLAYDVFERGRRVVGTDRRKAAEHMSPSEAALIIQQAFRCRKAFKAAKFRARLLYKKAFDAETRSVYYWNERTQRSTWVKPRFLGSDDVRMTPRSKLPNSPAQTTAGRTRSARDAALIVQSFARMALAKREARSRCKAIMKKVVEADVAYPLYVNTITGERLWHKPRILGREDLEISS